MNTKAAVDEVLGIDVDKIKLLGNKERLEILALLLKEGAMSWTAIENKLELNPNSLNFHLNKLIRSELIARSVKENNKGHAGTEYSILERGKKDLENLPKKEAK